MALSDVTLNIRKNGLGLVTPGATGRHAKIGVCSKGTVNSVANFGSLKAAQDALGVGPLVEAIAAGFAAGAKEIAAVPANPSQAGTVTGAFTLTGSGTGTVTGGKGPSEVIQVKIVTGGALATMQFQVKVGSGAYGSTITSGANPYTYKVPGTLTTLAFGNVTYTINDVYALNLDGTITRTGAGPATALDTSTHEALDNYAVRVLITTAGAAGVGVFRYSLDGGNSYSGDILIPSSGKCGIPDSGVTLTFAGTFTKDDVYAGTTATASYSSGDLTNALVALRGNALTWEFVHVVGTPANAAAAASIAAVVDTQMGLAEAEKRYAFGIIEVPTSESDSTIAAAFASVSTERCAWAAGDEDLASPISGLKYRRNLAWSLAARLAAIKPSRDAGAVEDGALIGVTKLHRDEAANPALDAARFTVARSRFGLAGFYVEKGRMGASPGSDFTYIVNRRVMDRACENAYTAYQLFINKDLRIDSTTGYVDARDADVMDANVTTKLRAALAGEVSDVRAEVSRGTNILSTGVLPATVTIIPKGYAREISVTIGFTNPAIAAAAA